MTRAAVCFGSPSPEHDISILTGLQAARALGSGPLEVVALYWARNGAWYQVPNRAEAADFADGVPRGSTPVQLETGPEGGFWAEGRRGRRTSLGIDGVVNCCHGVPGEDGTLQGVFDLAGLRYTGPSARGAALGMDKLAFAGVMELAGLPTLPTVSLTPSLTDVAFPPPYIVKPRFGGSSIGIHVVDDLATAAALVATQHLLAEGAVLQPYLADAVDLNICVKTYPSTTLSAVERPLRAPEGRIYTYAEKYLQGAGGMASAPRELPAALPPAIEGELRSHAAAITDVALVRSVARIDFLWDADRVYVNEINTIPGALGWYFWDHEGIPFGQLLTEMLAEAELGPSRQFRTEGADGTALRSAGSIASKLA
jgi:D-alanine-D-alanine ligase